MPENPKNCPQKGFTLIETLIYVAFLSLMMGTLLAITFSTLDATGQINKKIVVQQEANFLLRKMAWALSGAGPLTSVTGNDISIIRYSPPTSVSFKQNGNFVDMDPGAGAQHLNSQNVLVSGLSFTKTQASGQPAKIQGTFTVSYLNDASNSQTFQFTRYLRQ